MNLFKEKKNYYEILGVSDSASQQEIEDSFKQIDEYYNPEKVSDLSDEKAEYFLKARKAYETLSNVSKRKKYDRKLFEDVDTFEYEDEKQDVNKVSESNIKQTTKSNKSKLNVYPKAKEVLGKHKYKLIVGGLIIASLVAGYKIGKALNNNVPMETSVVDEDDTIDSNIEQENKLLTAENIEQKAQEILADNQSKGLNIDPIFIKSALFITNIDYLDQEDIKTLYANTDLNMIEEIQNMYNYTSAVGTHNNNVALGQEEGQYISLAPLAYDSEDKTILEELNTEFVDLANGLKNKEMTSEEFQESFKYVTEFYTGRNDIVTNGTEYSNYSLTSGGGLLSEQYWPMFSVVYADSEYITAENKVDIKTLSYGTDGTDAVVNGSKYLGSIINHESLKCLEDTSEMEAEKTLTKTQ